MICSVCIAAYKRPELLDKLLQSLINQTLSEDLIIEIIVVDNDPEESGEQIVRKFHNMEQVSFRYFRQPIKNISLTRNLAVANANGTHILFIDDDEVACSHWIVRLLEVLRKYDADGVFGPVIPRFEHTAPQWIEKGRQMFAGTIPATATGTEAIATWSGNCLVKASLLRHVEGPFNPEYGLTGGEDTELFDRLKRSGSRFVYCNEALVFEYWPPERTRVSYLVKRSFKGTNTLTRRTIAVSNRKMIVRLFMLLKAICYGLISLVLVAIALPSKVWRTYWEIKFASNVGRFLAVFGQYYQAYK